MRQDNGGFERGGMERLEGANTVRKPLGGLVGWLLDRWQGRRRAPARLAVLERIALAPRQSLALVEAEGRRFLLATSADGTPAFCPLQDTQAVGDQSARTNGPVQQLKDGAGRDAKVVAW